jgi:hypothetical protein
MQFRTFVDGLTTLAILSACGLLLWVNWPRQRTVRTVPIPSRPVSIGSVPSLVEIGLFAEVNAEVCRRFRACNRTKSGRFEDRALVRRRGFEGRLRGPRSWVGGLLSGGHAPPRHPARRPSQALSASSWLGPNTEPSAAMSRARRP